MCLSFVEKRRDLDSLRNIKEKLAWKVFDPAGRGKLKGRHFYIRGLEVNKWLEADAPSGGAPTYIRGFHSFATYDSAARYGGETVIRAVKVKHFLAIGLQGPYGRTYVTRYMKVLSARETRRLAKKVL